MAIHRKVIQARTDLILDDPFFGVLALHLKLKEDPGCGTAWVDGESFGYDPAFIDALSSAQVQALFAHEVMHCAMGHPWRRDGRKMAEWNIACDAAINTELQAAGFTMPPDGVYAQGDEVGKSAEWIYSRRHRDDPQAPPKKGGKGKGKGTGTAPGPNQTPPDPNTPPQSQPDGQGGQGQPQPKPDPFGELRDAPTAPDADGEPAPTEQDWRQKVAAAAQQAKMQGKLPAGMERLIGEALKPKVDVKALLLRFFSERAQSDYSWTRPNPRYIAQGLYLPALHSHELGEVAIMVDTSGSIGGVALDHALGIVQEVIDECNPAAVTLIFADASVQRVRRLEKGEPITWEPKGGGGTDFRPAIEHIEQDGNFVCALCITDLYGTFPDNVPTVPVIWLSTTANKQAPFGETVYADY
ncbi:MAG TPA: VWA-like domain-containing protein [Candidatus Acidoferrales bacterium]|nr:VWA-like domain-containing protein [Candidatus Acidoferrales bacterium]